MGPNYSISTACATSNFCILNAANHIIRGEAVSILNADLWECKLISVIIHLSSIRIDFYPITCGEKCRI